MTMFLLLLLLSTVLALLSIGILILNKRINRISQQVSGLQTAINMLEKDGHMSAKEAANPNSYQAKKDNYKTVKIPTIEEPGGIEFAQFALKQALADMKPSIDRYKSNNSSK